MLNARRDGRPARAVFIGRPSKWGNSFVIGRYASRAQVVARYRAWLCEQPELVAALPELRGRGLVCFCAPAACRGDLLLAVANGAEPSVGAGATGPGGGGAERSSAPPRAAHAERNPSARKAQAPGHRDTSVPVVDES
ncbi:MULTISPECIES: DUF4326 domain-containing protein [Roseomonadaceae]|uniref:DUF4326 domain-containing protein n=1 Tax=Falsiroseomonas oleicola TaxID=2801474 RepID=A0ABS6HD57_9PROT|nr:DUF4326 domain-containing protein [Roseomonas oleicola]